MDSVRAAEERARHAEQRAHAAELSAATEVSRAAAEAEKPLFEDPASAGSASEPTPPSWAAESDAGADAPAPVPAPGEPLDINQASFDQLRGLNLSVTQATRVLSFREQSGGFDSLDQLAEIPGFPEEFLAQLRGKLTV
jgi:competence protein ComEA